MPFVRRTMDIYEAISCRRSVRSFKADPVPQEVLDKLLDAARCAPSSLNLQPWKFILIRNADIKHQVVMHCPGQGFIEEAPLLIAACALPTRGRLGDEEPSSAADVAVAFAHLSLAATAEGLGTCWITAFDHEPVKEILGVPDTARLVLISPIGYPTDATPRAKHRKTLNEIICEDRFA